MEEAIRRGLRIPGTTSDIYNPYRDGIEKGSMESFHEYLKLTLPKGWTADPAHIKLIAEHLDAVDRGQIDRLAISMPPRHGKPVWVESLVLMGDGTRKPIKDVVIGDFVITHEGRPRQVLEIFKQGLLDCVKITTKRGRVTTAALTHPFLTTTGWMAAGDLREKMNVVHLSSVDVSTTDDSARARMAGFFIGDGTTVFMRDGKSCQSLITCHDEETGLDISRTAEKCGWVCNINKHTYSISGGSRDWLYEVGIAGKNSHTKVVPDFVFKSNKDTIANFIAAYFMCDGSVNQRGKLRTDCCVSFSSVSKELLIGVQHLLLRFGINATLRTKMSVTNFSKGEKHTSYVLALSSLNDVFLFRNTIPVIGPKNAKLNEWLVYPDYYGERKFICDQVASVEPVGQLECMCLTVEEDHTFTSDDFIVHNTETTTVRYGAYAFEKNPRDNVLVTAYNERIARRFSRKARVIVESRRQLMTSSRAADEWGMPEGGTFMSRGVGSPPTGVGFKRIIIDDPIRRREDAESINLREKAWDWFTDDIYTRLEPGGAMIIVATRWHHDDITSRAIESEPNKWVVLKLPAIAEEADQLGRQPGESLWPERYSVEDLMRIKAVMLQNEGEYGWQALYQQSPTQRSGAMIRQDRISTFQELPLSVGRFRRVIRAWDLASTRGAGDYTVGVKGALDNIGRFWILDVVIGQFDVDERDNIIYRTAEMDGKDVTIRLPQDPAQAGKSQARYLLRMLHGYRVSIQSPTGNKTLRAEPFAAQVNNFNVNMIAAAWNQPMLDEFRQFPMGRHDDIVDATVDCYDECTKKRTMSFA